MKNRAYLVFLLGIVFGFGMVIAGGWGSGSVWRAGEGQVKLILAVICFALSTSLFKALIKSSGVLTTSMGRRIFLPDFLTYKWTLVVIVLVMLIYYLAATWNEETDKFTVEL
jgi:uncharacterized membrane protein YedE/YeeE